MPDHEMHPDLPENVGPAKLRNSKSLEDEIRSDFWINKAKAFVDEQVRKRPNKNKAKNIILFVGDGMSHPSIAAARVAMGDENMSLSFEKFPYTASSKTYCIDLQVPIEELNVETPSPGLLLLKLFRCLSPPALRQLISRESRPTTESSVSVEMRFTKTARRKPIQPTEPRRSLLGR